MKKTLLLSICLSSFIVADKPKVYIDMNPVWMKYESKGISDKFKPTGFKWTMGYEFKKFSFASVALEGSALLGVKSDTKSTVQNNNGDTFNNAQIEVDEMYSLNIKTMFPLSEAFNANLYLGATRGKVLSSSDESNQNSEFESSFSSGFGLEYWTKENMSLYANYMQYFKNLDAIEVGVGFRF